jgi:PAS domain S-box-containing protein
MANAAETAWDGERLLAASMEAMALVDGQEHISVNEPYADLYGFPRPAALDGTAWERRFAERERQRLREEVLPACRADGLWRGLIAGRRQESATFPQELSVARVSDGWFVCTAREAGDGVVTESDRRMARYETIVETVDDGVYALDEGLRFTFVNDGLCEMTGLSRDSLLGMPATDLFAYDDEVEAAEEIRRRAVQSDDDIGTVQATLPTPDGERVLEARYRLHPGADGEYRGSVGIVRDVTDREDHERRLERQRDELETLNRINELLLTITRDLFASPTRDEIEQTVCERLAASELYQFAWIGEPETAGDRIVPRTSAGIDQGYVEAATVTTADADTGRGPGGRAIRTGDVQVCQDVRTDPSFEPWRDAALDRGVRSAAAVPLVNGDATYGILAVYATRPLAFSQREQAGFETLGEAIGFAINAIENRNLLFADTVVELEFEVTDPGLVFVRASERLGCEITISGYVASESDEWSVYLTVSGATPTAVGELAGDDPTVEQARVIADGDDAGSLEFVMEGSALHELSKHGAMLTSGHVDDGRGRFCIEAPQSADVRKLTDRLRTAYPDSTLVAQREFDRPVQRALEMRESVEDQLTDRQQEAVSRAYHEGYFDWPRRNTAGDVADAMGIAETTFHYHLRNALDTLVTALPDLEKR